MTCKYLKPLIEGLEASNVTLVSAGQTWSNAGKWWYFNCILEPNSLRIQHQLPDNVIYHTHLGTHSGTEAGFYCESCQQGVMGIHPMHNPHARLVSQTNEP